MARFIPDDGSIGVAEEVARRVLEAYSQIEADLIAEIARRVAHDLPAVPTLTEKLRVIGQLQKVAENLIAGIPADFAQQVVDIAAERGWAFAAQTMQLTSGVPMAAAQWGSAFVPALTAIVGDLHNAFDQVHLRILRYPVDAVGAYVGSDVYQQIVGQTVTQGLSGRLGPDQIRRKALYRFLQKGVTGFTDRSNRQWRIGSYTEMATRTAVGRAHLEGNVARMVNAGIYTATVLGSQDACSHCAPWFGKILSLKGAPAGYYWEPSATDAHKMVKVHVDATLEEARAAGLHHPNCACSEAAYQPGMTPTTMADHFDPIAYDLSQKQRGIERSIRDDRRKLAAAQHLAIEDVPSIKASIKTKQAELRIVTGESGRHRKYQREQPRFTDG